MYSNTAVSSPLVSVVLASYNGARFIAEQLDSILGQTYPHIEIIIVDDASADETLAIVQAYCLKYESVKLYPGESNIGYLKNFERGILLSTGDYIAFCDQDDIWLPEKIEVLMQERADHSLIYCNSELIDAAGKRLGIRLTDLKNLKNFDSPLNYVVGGTASGHAMLVKREVVLQSLPWPYMVTHDYWVGFVSTFTSTMKFVDRVLVLYRQHDENVIGIKGGGMKSTPKKFVAKNERNMRARERMRLMYEKCPEHLTEEKRVFSTLSKTYEHFTLGTNFTRMMTFFKYRHQITAYKKRNELRKLLFCLKMFAKIV
jgi:glycosyltransferase involved in cell wall biosynthesis